MKKSRDTQEQIIRFFKQAEAGMPVQERCRKHGVGDQIVSDTNSTVPPVNSDLAFVILFVYSDMRPLIQSWAFPGITRQQK